MEYKVGYIRLFYGKCGELNEHWTVGMIYEGYLHIYDYSMDAIKIASGKEARNCFAINPNGLAKFENCDIAEKCFKATIEDFKIKEKAKEKKEAIKEKARIIKAKKDSNRDCLFILILIILVSIGYGLAIAFATSKGTTQSVKTDNRTPFKKLADEGRRSMIGQEWGEIKTKN